MKPANQNRSGVMEAFVRALNSQDSGQVRAEFERMNLDAVFESCQGDLVKRRFLSTLVDLPSRLQEKNNWLAGYHHTLLAKAESGSDVLLADILKRVPRDLAVEYLESKCCIQLLPHFLPPSTLYRACLNSVKHLGDLDRHRVLRDIKLEDVKDYVRSGTLDVAVLQTICVVSTDLLWDEYVAFWASQYSLDPGPQLYQAVILCTLLGNVCMSETNISLIDGIQRRLSSCDFTVQMIARTVAELMSRLSCVARDSSTVLLDMKVDYCEPACKEMLNAFNMAQRISDLHAIGAQCPLVLFDNQLMNAHRKTKAARQDGDAAQCGEPIPKNDKNRVKPFLADALTAISQHDNPTKRANGIHVLLEILPLVSELELSDHCEQLASKLVLMADCYHVPDADSKLLALRMTLSLRLPILMAQRAASLIFGKQIGLIHKTEILTCIVKACQFALRQKPVESGLSQYLLTLPAGGFQENSRQLACTFMSECIVKANPRFKYLSNQDGFIGERLYTALATLIPTMSHCNEYPALSLNLSRLLHSHLIDKAACPKGMKRGAMLLLMALCAHYPQALPPASAPDLHQFVTNVALICEAFTKDPSGDIRTIALNLAGLLKQEFPVERLILSMDASDDNVDRGYSGRDLSMLSLRC